VRDRIWACLFALTLLSQGCYFGRTPRAKVATYAANGFVVAVGTAVIIATATEETAPCIEMGVEVDCDSGHFSLNGYAVGAIFMAGALAAAVVTYLVPTKSATGDTVRRKRR
jgi:hypothetical protein